MGKIEKIVITDTDLILLMQSTNEAKAEVDSALNVLKKPVTELFTADIMEATTHLKDTRKLLGSILGIMTDSLIQGESVGETDIQCTDDDEETGIEETGISLSDKLIDRMRTMDEMFESLEEHNETSDTVLDKVFSDTDSLGVDIDLEIDNLKRQLIEICDCIGITDGTDEQEVRADDKNGKAKVKDVSAKVKDVSAKVKVARRKKTKKESKLALGSNVEYIDDVQFERHNIGLTKFNPDTMDQR